MSRALLALLLTPALAGCAFPDARGPCGDREPLTIRTYVDVADPKGVRIDVSLWNCRDEPLRLRQECFPYYHLYPRVTWDGATYVIASNATATPEGEVHCWPPVEEGETPVEPGASPGVTGLPWAGTFDVPGAEGPVRILGNHTLRVQAAGYLATTVVEVPP